MTPPTPKSKEEPTRKDVISFVESQLSDMEAYGYAHRDSMVDGIMQLLEKQNDYAEAILNADTPQDKKLEEILDTSYGEVSALFLSNPEAGTKQVMPAMQILNISNKAKRAILAWHQSELAKARINEVSHCCDDCGMWHTKQHDKNSFAMTFAERLEQLHREKESMNE